MAKARVKFIYFLIGVVVLGAIFLPGYSKFEKLKARSQKLERRISIMEAENKRMEEEKKKLESDLTYMEEVAREKLGMVKKGEIVYKAVKE